MTISEEEYCRLYLLEESEENLRARYAIILKQRDEVYNKLEEALRDSFSARVRSTLVELIPGGQSSFFARFLLFLFIWWHKLHIKLAHTVKPNKVAEDGYNGMMKGELNVVSGLPVYQKPFVSMTAMFPKKMMMDYVYGLQIADGAKK